MPSEPPDVAVLVRRNAGVEAEVVGRGILLRLRPVRGVLRLSANAQTHGEHVAQAIGTFVRAILRDAAMEWQTNMADDAAERLAALIDAQGITTQTPMSQTEEHA